MKFIFTLASLVVFQFTALNTLAGDSWETHCQARHEVHEVQSQGQCQALFKLKEDGAGLEYKLLASNLEFVTQAHIHMAPSGQNGPVVAFLFGFVAQGVSPNGLLARGIITDADLIEECRHYVAGPGRNATCTHPDHDASSGLSLAETQVL